jgi:hypothetical protein
VLSKQLVLECYPDAMSERAPTSPSLRPTRGVRRRTKLALVLLAGPMLLAGWDVARGRSPEDLMLRTEAAFLDRASMHGCDDAERKIISANERHTTHYGVRYPSPAHFAGWMERTFGRRYEGWLVDDVRVEHAGEPEAISFPSGGRGCYDNLFIPVRVEVESDWGPTLTFPMALRVTQRVAGRVHVPFVDAEVTGLYRDDGLPPRRHRGRVSNDGDVPPAR